MFKKHVIPVETENEHLIGQVVTVFYDELWDWPSDKYRNGDIIEYHYIKKDGRERSNTDE